MKINTPSKMLYRAVLNQLLQGNSKSSKEEIAKINKEIERQTQRLKNARVLMLDGEILPEDYRQMKIEIEEGITKLNARSTELADANTDFSKQIDFFLMLFANIDKEYKTANTDVKQKIISSIFPTKLFFDGEKYRTNEINEVIPLICREKGEKKREGSTIFCTPSLRVDPERFELSSK